MTKPPDHHAKGARPHRVGRRNFLKGVPAAVAAVGPLASGVTSPAEAADPAAAVGAADVLQEGLRQESLKSAQELSGLHFTDAEAAMALPGALRNRDSFEALRRLEIPLDTEPAMAFHPYLPGTRPKGRSTRNAVLRVAQKPVRVTSRLDDLASEPVTVLSALVRRRHVTSMDLTKMYLARLEKYGDALHCVVTLTRDLALAQAAKADRDLKAGRYHGALHGIPWGAKDLFATRGIRTTWGAAPYANQVIDTDATVVERLRDAGAVLVAKLSMGSLAQGGVWFGGTTRNPWNAETGSSGSSAGSCAATAAGLVGFALGTETRGSIITPASLCGVVGLRPTYGRVSRYGAMALSW
ncbi:MAG: amidase, partial [Acidobacteriota bacterium]